MFVQPCLIRKNTPELRAALEEIGYEKDHLYAMGGNEFPYLRVFDESNKIGGKGPVYTDVAEDAPLLSLLDVNNTIDCSDNERMFLAFAALKEE